MTVVVRNERTILKLPHTNGRRSLKSLRNGYCVWGTLEKYRNVFLRQLHMDFVKA